MSGDDSAETLAERNLRMVLVKALYNAAKDEEARLRGDHLAPLLERYDGDGSVSYKVRLPGTDGGPGGPLVAKVTLTAPDAQIEVIDEPEFLDWLEANHPDLVTVEVIAAVPGHEVWVEATEEQRVRKVDARGVAELWKHFKDSGEEGVGIVDETTGVGVAGVVTTPAPRPKSFQVRYEKDGVEQLAQAYRQGRLDHVVAGTTLPPVGKPPMIERRLDDDHDLPDDGGQAMADLAPDEDPYVPLQDKGDGPGPLLGEHVKPCDDEDCEACWGSYADRVKAMRDETGSVAFDPGDW